MEITTKTTKFFKDVFPTYEVFSNWYKQTGLSKNDNDCPNQITFLLIAYEYNDSHIAFTEESFKEHFAIDLYTYYKEFEGTTKAIEEMLELTDSEISIADSTILNIANIPENESSTDIEQVDFVSQQQKTLTKKGVLQVKREQLTNKRTYTTKTFLKRFKHLFIRILSPAYTFVVEEPEGE